MADGKSKKVGSRSMIECRTCKMGVDLEPCKGLTDESNNFWLDSKITQKNADYLALSDIERRQQRVSPKFRLNLTAKHNKTMTAEAEEYFGTAPLPKVQYPLTVHYCGNCSMPVEYCEFYPSYEKCKAWLEQNLPEVFSQLNVKDGGTGDKEGGGGGDGGGGDDGEDEKKRQKRGGKGMVRLKKKDDTPKKYCEFYPSYEKCKAWLEQNLPEVFSQLNVKDGGTGDKEGGGGGDGGGGDDGEDEKKRQKRGGKGMVRLKKKDDTPKK
ncbi:hypothetical protein FHG87_023914, partial [Trinorchestia longiramus]